MAKQEQQVWWPTKQIESVIRAMQLLEKTGTKYSTTKDNTNTPYWHVSKIVNWAEPLALGAGGSYKADAFEKNVRGMLSVHGVDACGTKGEGYFEGGGKGLYRLTPIGRGYHPS